MKKVNNKEEYKKLVNAENNAFKEGDFVEVAMFCDKYGNEIDDTGNRYNDLFKKGKIDFVMGNDFKGGYVYGIEGSEYCFNKYELKLVE